MTSNQLSYWRLQEEQRANRAREKENERHNVTVEAEDRRHNTETERINDVQNNLRERGLEIERAANFTRLQELYGKYGTMALNQMPNSIQREFATSMGLDANALNDADFDSTLSSVWEEIKSVFSTFGSVLKGLF